MLDFVNDTTAFGNEVEWFSGGTPTHNYMNDPTTESGVLLIVEGMGFDHVCSWVVFFCG